MTDLIPRIVSSGLDGPAACRNQCLDLLSLKREYGHGLTFLPGMEADILETETLSPSGNERNVMRNIFLLTAMFVFLAVPGFPECAVETEKELPFCPGEKLTLKVKWGFITAGEAVLEVLSPEIINGVRVQHFVATLRTTAFVDAFYKIRTRIDSFADMETGRSVLYKKRKRGFKTKDILVTFDWEKNQARYYSSSGKKKPPVTLLPGTLDPLALFYAFRLYEIGKVERIKRPVTDGKKCVEGKLRVIKKQKIRVADKIFDSYLVEPDMEQVDGIFEKFRDAKLRIWVTADSRHIPLRIKSSVIVGSFVGELVSAKGLKPACK